MVLTKISSSSKKTERYELPQSSLASPAETELHIRRTQEFKKVVVLFL